MLELLKVVDVAPRNLINLESVFKSYGKDPVLQGVSLGIGEGERIGIVGRNGGGKSTLLRVIAGVEFADSGRVTSGGNVRIGILAQRYPPIASVGLKIPGIQPVVQIGHQTLSLALP